MLVTDDDDLAGSGQASALPRNDNAHPGSPSRTRERLRRGRSQGFNWIDEPRATLAIARLASWTRDNARQAAAAALYRERLAAPPGHHPDGGRPRGDPVGGPSLHRGTRPGHRPGCRQGGAGRRRRPDEHALSADSPVQRLQVGGRAAPDRGVRAPRRHPAALPRDRGGADRARGEEPGRDPRRALTRA